MSSILGPSRPYKLLAEGTVTVAANVTNAVTLGEIGDKIVHFSVWPETENAFDTVYNTGSVHQPSDDAFSPYIYACISRRNKTNPNSALQLRNHDVTITVGYIVREIK